MADIKVKQNKKGTIRTINKAIVGTERIKNRLVQTKDKTEETCKEETSDNGTEYAINKISKTIKESPNNINRLNKYGKRSFDNTVQNIQKVNKKINAINKKRNIKKEIERNEGVTKTTKKAIKTADRTARTTKQVIHPTTKDARRAMQKVQKTAKATVKTIKTGIKATITTIKAIAVATKSLIAFIVAGGWIAVLIIIIVCLVGLLCTSTLGIFFSNEDIGNKTMSSVIKEINIDFTNKITEIQKSTKYDEYEINSNRAEWKDVLSIFAVIVSNGNEQTDLITVDNSKINKLKEIFWQMNEISSRVEEIEQDIEVIDEDGNKKVEKRKIKMLYIDITNKSLEKMTEIYNLSSKQKEQLVELQSDEYNSMWSYLFYRTGTGSRDIVEVAISQIGNKGRTTLLVLVWLFF